VTDLAGASALVLAAVFVWAAAAKATDRSATTASFRGLGLPVPSTLSVLVPIIETAVAVGLVAAPASAAWAAVILLVAFSVVVARAVASGVDVSCACFGSGPGAESGRAVSVVELVRNAGLAGLGIVATGAAAGIARWPGLPALVIVTVTVALSRVGFAIVDLRRIGGHVLATPLPGEARR
jgi:uncharacterized membrane protein YphA (DoxX/SURF4 family)